MLIAKKAMLDDQKEKHTTDKNLDKNFTHWSFQKIFAIKNLIVIMYFMLLFSLNKPKSTYFRAGSGVYSKVQFKQKEEEISST